MTPPSTLRSRPFNGTKRDKSRLAFIGKFTVGQVDHFLANVDKCLADSYTNITFDFTDITGAWPDSMVPVLVTADWLKANDCTVSVVLPVDEELRRLFINTSWAHYLDPNAFTARDVNIDHFNARRFRDASEQQRVVSEIMRIAVVKLPLPKDILTALEWSINEITDNVLIHSESKSGGIVQAVSLKDRIIFCVADSGRGILASMREGHSWLRTDTQALGEAVKAGVTRDPKVGQGNGLAGTLKIAALSGGRFHVASYLGRLSVHSADARQSVQPHAATFHGTMVTASIRIAADFKIEEALGFSGFRGEHLNILDFHDEEGDVMILRLKEETSGVGSRFAGAFVREKCRHLLEQDRRKPLVLDWDGVPLISSSFADEALGKLFLELGPLVFGARIRHRNMDALRASLQIHRAMH
jgi:anti-sigma regulatory factor (Ser/Thr protein kinase)